MGFYEGLGPKGPLSEVLHPPPQKKNSNLATGLISKATMFDIMSEKEKENKQNKKQQLKWKYFLLRFEPPIHGLWVEIATTEPFYFLMSGHKTYIKYQWVALQINHQYAHVSKMTNCE